MNLTDWQLVSIVVSIVGSAVGATAWITWRLSKANTKIENLEGILKKSKMILDICSGWT
jgi:hypothetical protein